MFIVMCAFVFYPFFKLFYISFLDMLACNHYMDVCIMASAAVVTVENIFTSSCPQTSCCVVFAALQTDAGRSFSLWFHLQPKKTHQRKEHVYSESLQTASTLLFLNCLLALWCRTDQKPYGGLIVAALILHCQHPCLFIDTVKSSFITKCLILIGLSKTITENSRRYKVHQ